MKSIDLLSFLENYYGIVNQSLKLNILTHRDIKILFPNIKRSSFEMMNNNFEEVYNGELVLVHDAKGSILPYVNPHINISFENTLYDRYENNIKIDITNIDLSHLSKNELLQIRRKLKRNHKIIEESNVVKEIRKNKGKKY